MSVESNNQRQFQTYLTELHLHIQSYSGINPFWAGIYEEFRTRQASVDGDVITAINSAPKTGYLVQRLSTQEFDAQWDKMRGYLLALDHAGNVADLPREAPYEGVLVLWYLREIGRMEDARQVLRQAGLAPKYVNLRHTYYAAQILKALNGEQLDVLEIGAGGSALKVILKTLLGSKIESYTIVDLPEMLCMSIAAALSFYKDEAIKIASEGPVDTDARHVFVPANNANALSERKFNLFLNTHSFQEMDDSVIAGYFETIYAAAEPGALFFNTNWRQPEMTRLDGTPYDNDPARYPYRHADAVIYDGVDPLHDTLKKRFGLKKRTPSRTSIRRINPTAA